MLLTDPRIDSCDRMDWRIDDAHLSDRRYDLSYRDDWRMDDDRRYDDRRRDRADTDEASESLNVFAQAMRASRDRIGAAPRRQPHEQYRRTQGRAKAPPQWRPNRRRGVQNIFLRQLPIAPRYDEKERGKVEHHAFESLSAMLPRGRSWRAMRARRRPTHRREQRGGSQRRRPLAITFFHRLREPGVPFSMSTGRRGDNKSEFKCCHNAREDDVARVRPTSPAASACEREKVSRQKTG